MRLPVVHHHGFKCAGSTVVHLLNRNWRDRVLHIEHRIADRRLHCSHLRGHVESGNYRAATSHLLTMPAVGDELAHVHFGLVRDPIQRLLSAYKFMPADERCTGFADWLELHRHYACDYQVRQLVTPDDARGPWDAAPDAVPLGQPHVLLGLVERFEDSMFLLERRLARVDCAFDGSVGGRQNVGSGAVPFLDEAARAKLREWNAGDLDLHRRAGEAIDRELADVDPDGSGRAEYRARCAARSGQVEPYLGLDSEDWVYVED